MHQIFSWWLNACRINFNLAFHISEDGSETELRHCASLKISVKSSQKYFVHLNWIRLATNPNGSIAQLVERRSRNPMMRFQFPLKTKKFSLISAVSDWYESSFSYLWGWFWSTQPNTPQTSWKLFSNFPACYNLSTGCNRLVNFKKLQKVR